MAAQSGSNDGIPRTLSDEQRQSIAELRELAKKIVDDGEVDDEEVAFIEAWLEKNRAHDGTWPFSTLLRLLGQIKEDGEVDERERMQLMSLLSGLQGLDD